MMLRALALFGRHGTWFLAVGLFVGLLAPPLASLLRPALGVLIFALTTATFLATDWPALAAHARRPELLLIVLAWTLLAAPVLTALTARVTACRGRSLKGWCCGRPRRR